MIKRGHNVSMIYLVPRIYYGERTQPLCDRSSQIGMNLWNMITPPSQTEELDSGTTEKMDEYVKIRLSRQRWCRTLLFLAQNGIYV